LRQGDWKILAAFDPATGRLMDIDERSEREVKSAELRSFSLYNLRNDIGETNDLSATEPEKLAGMRAVLEAKYREVRDETPVWPHWKHVNLESQMIVWPDYYLQKKAAPKKK
ncbi:MAG: hypothetical protein HC814_05550, partial [Rhodobacteraceae bacterium]|nr:hypothetical protein [Paracoccaceae bacterium]